MGGPAVPCLHGDWRAAKAPPPARLGRTLPRPSPWLGSRLPVGQGRGRGQTWLPAASPRRPPTTSSSSGLASRAPSLPTTWPSVTGTPFCWSRYRQPQPCRVPCPTVSSALLCPLSHCVPSSNMPGWAPADLAALCHGTDQSRCQHPCVLTARTPTSPVPRLPCPCCQDPHVTSARTPTSPGPGPHVTIAKTPMSCHFPAPCLAGRTVSPGPRCGTAPVHTEPAGLWGGGDHGHPHVSPAPQFILPHSRGSSHGQSRITRSAYPQAHYARMMPDSFRLWRRLEDEAGTSLYR